MLPIAATLVCAAACLVLVAAEAKHARAVQIASKLVASAAFVVVGAGALRLGHDVARVTFGQWIFVGLVFGALGDAALLGRGSRWFLAGLVAFLIGHLSYVVAIAYVVAPARWFAEAGPLAAAPIAVGLGALAWLWPRLGSMRVPVVIYVGAIVAMVVGALAMWRAGVLPAPRDTYFVIGACAFFVSDLAVARDRFVAREFSNRAWGLPAYYSGQLLIAWTVSY